MTATWPKIYEKCDRKPVFAGMRPDISANMRSTVHPPYAEENGL
jgi:hypothetical protein